jgi:hypothetical protein
MREQKCVLETITNDTDIKTLLTYLPRKMEQTECSETSAHKIQTPGNYPEENIQQKTSCLLFTVRSKFF